MFFRERPVLLRLLLAVICLAVLLTAAAAIKQRMETVRVVLVDGVEEQDSERVRALSGITVGMPMRDVTPNDVNRAMRQDPTFALTGLEKKWPNAVTLHVRKREKFAAISFLGMTYVIGSDCVLMSTEKAAAAGLIEVTVPELTQTPVGMPLALGEEAVFEQLSALLARVEQDDLRDITVSIAVADIMSVKLTTVSGNRYLLGELKDAADRAAWVPTLENAYMRSGMLPGETDLTSGQNADYHAFDSN